MRLLKGLTVGAAAFCVLGLAGCSDGASVPSAASRSAIPGPRAATSYAAPAAPASPQQRAGARAAAAQFYGLYSTSRFAAFWNLLSPAMKRQVPQRVWISVHDACASAVAGKSRTIEAVTVFGNAAIVTESIAGAASKPGTTEDVFDYADGRWSYSPVDVGIYQHGSIAADISAAKAAGYCASSKVF
jgi:hypothetical protein